MLPIDFIELMRKTLGKEAESLFRALETEPETSIRLNDKIDTLSFPCDTDEVPWHIDGYYLSERVPFTLDPLFHAGCYYVQEASSMFLQQVLDKYVSRSSIVLDLCAAPGGKSTLISQHLYADDSHTDAGLLISNEVVRQRVFVLSENILKWGNGNVVVTHNRPSDFGEGCSNLFDCVLVDAPCSGEGMFRKDLEARTQWSLNNVYMCQDRQRSILSDVWDALKPGGVLIYSTCTFNRKENEENVIWICEELGAEVLPIPAHQSWGIQEDKWGYHFYPHRTRGEGLFMTALRKKANNYTPFRIRQNKKKDSSYSHQDENVMYEWLKTPEKWAIRQSDRFMTAYPKQYKELIDFLSSFLTCISVGFGIGEVRGKGISPQHSLSQSKDLKKEAFQEVMLNREQALCYLRAEALPIENGMSGTMLLTYDGVPLGFAKNVGNRLNNLYPNEWRIRHL